MGKFSKLIKEGIFTEFKEEGDYQSKVNEEKKRLNLETLTPVQLGALFVLNRVAKAKLEEQMKPINLTLAAIDQVAVAKLIESELSSIKTDLGTFYVQEDLAIKVEDKPALYKWVRHAGMKDLFTINHQTLSAVVKGRLEQLDPKKKSTIPPGIIVNFFRSFRFRRGKSEGEPQEQEL